MASYQRGLQLNNGLTIAISTLGNAIFNIQNAGDDIFTSFLAESATTPPTPIDLSGFCPTNKLILDRSFLSEVFGQGSIPLTPEYEESETYQALLSKLNNNVNWLWGSINAGGCFCYKATASTYGFGGVSGVYNYNGAKVYDFYVASYNGVPSDFIDCIFYVSENSITDEYNRLRLNIGINTYTQSIDQWHVNYADLINYIDDAIVTPFYEYTGRANWATIFEKTDWYRPLEVFNYRPGRVFWDFTSTPIYSSANIANWEYVSGDWSGGQDFDLDEGGNSETGGQDGDYDGSSDDVPESDGNNITNDVLTSGFITLYNPTLANLKSFNNYLFTDITDSIAEQIKRLQTNPLEYIVSISMCHFTPPSSLTDTIKFAGLNSGIVAPLISKQYITLDCGSVSLSEYFGNFLDYNPYSEASIYLPYIGIVPINIDDIQKSTIHIYYTIDLLSGSCIAQVKVTRGKRTSNDSSLNAILYEFQGNCFVNVPISSTDWHGAYNSIIEGVGGLANMAGGNILGGLAQSADAVMASKVSVQRTGSIQPSHGFMGKQYPYLILQRPIQNMPVNFKGFEGFTSNIRERVSNLSGYTEIDPDTIWTDNFGHATDEETQMIKDIMNGGVYL